MPRAARYKDQWNISLPESATVDELRACVFYEYARECQHFVDLVEKHRRDPHGTKHSEHLGFFNFTYLDFIDGASVPLANVVRAMGAKASLKRPWSALPKKLRAAIVTALFTPVRRATHEELEQSYCWQLCDEMPSEGTIFPIGPECDDAAGDDPRRFLCLVLDTRATAKQLKTEITRLFDRQIAPLLKDARGRNAPGRDSLRADLDNLSALRLLSGHLPAIAATIASKSGRGDLLPQRPKRRSTAHTKDTPTEPAPHTYARVARARLKFRALFPRLYRDEAFYPQEHMISAAAYDARHPSATKNRRPRQK